MGKKLNYSREHIQSVDFSGVAVETVRRIWIALPTGFCTESSLLHDFQVLEAFTVGIANPRLVGASVVEVF